MSKPVKNLIVESYRHRFAGVTEAVVVSLRGIDANANNNLRGLLAQKQIRITVVKNGLARRAWTGTPIEPLSEVLDGPSALVYGGETVVDIARELVAQAKQVTELQFRGALMEGQLFGPDQVVDLSKYPTRDEAQAQALQIVLSPGQRMASALLGPGRCIASLVKSIKEKLEQGEKIESSQ